MRDYKPAEFDLAVVGGGPVGASLACAARGLSVALLAREQRVPRPASGEGFDERVYALSPGNASFLESLGVWQRLPPARLAPVQAMRVFGDDGASVIEFDAYRAGVPVLAWIVEDGVLQDALWAALAVDIFAPAQCEALEFRDEAVELQVAGGQRLAARLIVGADGADSFVRRAAGIAAAETDYGQTAVVANFRCERAHGGTAWQWFQGGPVLALLPLPGEHVSMVWSLPSAQAQRAMRLEPSALAREVETASRQALGALEAVSMPKSYPLRRVSARRLVARRTALVGDAGHVIHPLAGQGMNLGLQDVRALARVLHEREPMRDPGELALLRRYERSRAEPIVAMDTVVDGLLTLFRAGNPLASRLRNAGLNLTDRLPVLKNTLMRRAMS